MASLVRRLASKTRNKQQPATRQQICYPVSLLRPSIASVCHLLDFSQGPKQRSNSALTTYHSSTPSQNPVQPTTFRWRIALSVGGRGGALDSSPHAAHRSLFDPSTLLDFQLHNHCLSDKSSSSLVSKRFSIFRLARWTFILDDSLRQKKTLDPGRTFSNLILQPIRLPRLCQIVCFFLLSTLKQLSVPGERSFVLTPQ